MGIKPILIIHPNDRTTSFLNKIKKGLLNNLIGQVHHFNIYPNDTSHNQCLQRISKHPEDGLIIFLGHGHTDKLFGSRGKYFDSVDYVDSEATYNTPHLFYKNENFINLDNIAIFSQKKVFCLSCNSNDKVAQQAFNVGGKIFLGFGDIPTSINEFKSKGLNVSNYCVIRMRAEVNYIIRTSLLLGLSANITFEALINYIHFITNQRITNILVNEKGFRERYILTDQLYSFKKEIKLFGDGRIRLLS